MFQEITLIGNLGRMPEMRYTPDGKAVMVLSVATNRRWKDFDTTVKTETTWWRVTVWEKLAEFCHEYLETGNRVLVKGRISPDEKTGGPRIFRRRDGSVGASYELVAQVVRSLAQPTVKDEDDVLEVEE